MPALEPRSYLILAGIATQLMEISVDNGYYTDAGKYVSVERAQVQDNDDAQPPFELRVVGPTINNGKDVNGHINPSKKTMDVVIEAAMPGDAANAQLIAHRVCDDLDRAMRKNLCNTPDGAYPVQVDKASILERPDGAPVVIVQLTGTVLFSKTT